MNTRTRESVNTLWEQPHGLAALFFFFFNIQLMIVFPFSKAACWRSFLYIMLTTVSSISLIHAAKWQTELTDCLTVILRMMSPVDLFLDLTFGLPRPASAITPEDRRTAAFPAPSAVSRIETPMHITHLLTGCLHYWDYPNSKHSLAAHADTLLQIHRGWSLCLGVNSTL